MAQQQGILEFRLLGGVAVLRDGAPLDLGGSKQRAILGLLMLNVGRVVSIDRLIQQLWGEEPPPAALGTIQSHISRLRRILEPDRPPGARARVVVTRPPGYILQADADLVDCTRFERLAREGRAALAEGRHAEALDSLAEARRLWRGIPLADVADDLHVEPDTARLEAMHLVAVEDEMEAALALGRHGDLVPSLEALLAEHPLRERLRMYLVLALYRSGRQADALDLLRQTRETLREELGIDPSPPLQRLEHQILSHDPELDVHATTSPAVGPAPVLVASDQDDGSEPEPARLPLVGREREVGQLRRMLIEASKGSGQILLLGGEPGIGKTRLAQEFELTAGATGGMTVAWGRSYDGVAPALWPWIQVLRGLTPAIEETPSLVPLARELEAGLSERDISGEMGGPGGRAAERARLFDGYARLLDALSKEAPLLLIMDDLHWADRPSLELLRFLSTQIGDSPILIIGIYRDVDLWPGHPLAEEIGGLIREPVTRRLSLAGLSFEAVAALLTTVLRRDPEGDLVEVIHRRTEGNPFFVSELARLLRSEDDPDLTARRTIPGGVRDLIRRRLARLPPQTTEVLVTGAVIGREFEFSLLGQLVGLPEDPLLDLLEAALLTGIVEETQEVGIYRFSHDLIREALAAELSSVRRARLDARIAVALEDAYGSDRRRSIQVATHAWAGRSHLEPDRVVQALLRGAEDATSRFDFHHARVLLERAADVVGEIAGPEERTRRTFEVQLKLAQSLLTTLGYAAPETGKAFDAARDAAAAAAQPAERAAMLFGLWAFNSVRASFSEAREVAEDLAAIASGSGDPVTKLLGHQTMGITAFHLGELSEAESQLAAAIKLADSIEGGGAASLGHEDLRVTGRVFRAMIASLQARQDASSGLRQEAFDLAQRLDHPYSAAAFYLLDSMEAAIVGDVPRARRHAGQALEISAQRDFRLVRSLAQVIAGWGLARDGDPTGGCVAMREAIEAARASGARMLGHFFLALLADAASRAELREEALAAARDGLSETGVSGERFYEAELHRLEGILLLHMGGAAREEGEASLRRAAATARKVGSTLLLRRAEESQQALNRAR